MYRPAIAASLGRMGVRLRPARAASQSAGERRAGPALDPGSGHVLLSLGERAAEIDAAAAILDQHRGKAQAPRIDRGKMHAEIGSEAGEKDARKAALAQIARKAGRGLPVVLVEGRIGV